MTGDGLGTQAERALLGYVIRKPDAWFACVGVSADTFSDPRMGAIWEGVGNFAATGQVVDPVSLELNYEEWGARGVPPVEHWNWLEAGDQIWSPASVVEVVLDDATRRFARLRLQQARADIDMVEMKPGQVLEDLVRDVHQHAVGTTEDMDAMSLRELLDMDFADEEWSIPRLLEKQDRVIITGTEGAGKTTLSRQIILFSAAGVHPLITGGGSSIVRMPPTRSLVIDAENTKKQWHRNAGWMVRRLRDAGAYDPVDNVHLATTGRLNLTRAEDVGKIHRLIDKHTPEVVFIGPLYKVAPGGLNKEDEAMQVIAVLDGIRDRGVSLIIEAHSGHERDSTGVRNVRPRGSSALMGWPEFGYGLRHFVGDGGPEENLYELSAWRGARESGRAWPRMMTRGGIDSLWPWVPQTEQQDAA